VVIDRPRGKAKTRLEEKQMGLLPYAVIRLPYEVEDIKLDEYGNISRIVFKENDVYRSFTNLEWIISKDKEGKQIIDSGSHELGVVPVVPVRWTDTVLEPAQIYLEYINFLISQMYKIVNLEFALGSQTGASGVALDFEFQQVNSLMAGMALHLEQAEYKIADLVARWNGESGFNGKIEYDKDFSFKDLERELKNAMDALSLQISQTFDAELKKKMAREILGDYIDENTIERIDKEIEGLEGADNQLKNEGL